ncbi:MAG TPA: PA14 domain-containing protein [Pyrinomonadaceae bacterium]
MPDPKVGTGNMPDLNETRRLRPAAPSVLSPIPSTRRRCPPQNPNCNGDAPARRPVAGIYDAGRGWADILLAAYTVPAYDLYGRAAYSVTDAPWAALLPPPAEPALLGAPTNLRVTYTSDARIRLEWDGVAGANGYRVERSPTKSGSYDPVGHPGGTLFDDTFVSRGNSYLYRVVAVDASGLSSSPSNRAFGTAVTFADDPLIAPNDPQGRPPTRVSAAHVNDLRTAVNALRVAADIGQTGWVEGVAHGVRVRATHVTELRTKLDEALAALGLTPAPYADTPLNGAPNGTPIRKLHFEQLRARVSSGVLSGGGGPAPGDGTGLTGTYFSGASFETYALTRTDATVNFDWGFGSPDPSVPADNFSVRWTGALLPRFTETYTFYVTSSDGVRLWIDGQPVVDNWTDHDPVVNSATVELVAGRKHAVTMEFYERAGVARARLEWQSQSESRQVVPSTQLFGCWKDVGQFVRDFYAGALGRQPSAAEQMEWTNRLAQAGTASQLIAEARALGVALFTSGEYNALNPNFGQDADARRFVRDLYLGYLQREPDQGGWNFWTTQTLLNGRGAVRASFGDSPEFQQKVRYLCGTSVASGARGGSGYNFSTARLDPANRTGATDTYSRNFNWSLPILSLRGRSGLDLGLTLSYNSLVWTRDQNGITFDADFGFPAPGFRLGFPVVQPKFLDPVTGKETYLLVSPSGARVGLRRVGTTNRYESDDSTYMQLTEDGGGLSLLTTDGTRVALAFVGNEYHCTEIKDTDGNYITVNYGANNSIQTIVDTLGRTITFRYDQFGNLQEIVQPWTREENGAPKNEEHKWATFGFGDAETLWPNAQLFGPNLAVVGTQGGASVPVLRQVALADGSYYKFEYNKWGQVFKVTHFAADSVGAGNVALDTHPLSYILLNLPGAPGASTAPRDDCPRYTERRDWIENGVNGVSGELLTKYTDWSPGATSHEVTAADDRTKVRETYETANWGRGLVAKNEVLYDNAVKKTTTIKWRHDGGDSAPYATNARVEDMRVIGGGRTVGVETTYTSFGLPQKIVEYKNTPATPLRTTKLSYELGAEYTALRIIGLVTSREVYDGAEAAANLRSKVGYVYDDPGVADEQGTKFLQATDTQATQHDSASYGATFLRRGHLNRLQTFELNTTSWAQTGAYEESRLGYNTTGSVIFSISARGHRATFNYADAFYNNVNRSTPARSTYAYQTSVLDPEGFKSSAWYNYDFGVITQTQTPKPNLTQPEQGDQTGPVVTRLYDVAGRIKMIRNAVNGSHAEWVYPASQNLVQTYSTVADDSIQNPNRRLYKATAFDGIGRVRGTASDLPVDGATDRYTGQRILYNTMGLPEYRSNPTEMTTANGQWTPAGEDTNNGQWRWMRQEFDWNGRPTVYTHPDGKQRWNEYDGCGCGGGEIVTSTDEGTYGGDNVLRRRKQRVYQDDLGRPHKTEDLNWDGSVYRTVTTELTVLSQVKAVVETAGTAGTSQTTSNEFDGYGRLFKTKTPQATAPTQYEYYPGGMTRKVTDGRGASTTYTYNGRGLVTNVHYAAPSPIPVPADANFGYDGAGNRVSMSDDMGSVVYEYDTLSRLKREARRFGNWNHSSPDGRYSLTYDYTIGGALKSITDPFGARIDYEYNDVAGRLTRVSGTPFNNQTEYASEFKYRAWGAVKSLKYGDNFRMAVGFNERLDPAGYDMTDPAGARVMGANYQYHDDGSLRFVDDLREDRFDRRFEYDHVGRATKAETGWLARQEAQPAAGDKSRNGPYNHYYGFDEFNHLTSRTGHYWYRESGEFYQATYLNNRNQRTGWNYDADGRETRSETTGSQPPPVYTTTYVQNYTYNAAGQRSDAGKYDGDGLRVKPAEGDRWFMRSTVLGGRSVTEIYSETGNPQEPASPGHKIKTFVYVGGEAVAEQMVTMVFGTEFQSIRYARRDPAGTSTYSSGRTGSYEHQALDFQGIATDAPDYQRLQQEQSYYNQRYSSYNYGASGGYNSAAFMGGMPGNYGTGCMVDGASTPCDIAMSLYQNGAAVPCPENNCGPRRRELYDVFGDHVGSILTNPFQAFADGWSGFTLAGTRYVGDGIIFGSMWTGEKPEKVTWDQLGITTDIITAFAYSFAGQGRGVDGGKKGGGGRRRRLNRSRPMTQQPPPTPTPAPAAPPPPPTPDPKSLLDQGWNYDSLGECLRRELQPYFKIDLGDVRIHHWMPKAPKWWADPDAYTARYDVYFKHFLVGGQSGVALDDQAYDTLVHEIVHVEQMSGWKLPLFWKTYLDSYLDNRLQGMNDHDAYRAIIWEKAARVRASQILQDYKSKNNGKLPCKP